jgi:hypothetical protein
MYFKVLEKGNGNYFVIITPKKTNKWVTIEKRQTGKLAGEVKRKIYENTPDMIIKNDDFTSTYVKKTYIAR